MAGSSLNSIVNGSLINRFRGLLQGVSSSSSSVKAALTGQSSTVSISDGLRLGARTYGTAVQALSATASFANLARSTLQDLDELTDKMMALAKRAASRQAGSQTRLALDREFKKLGADFREIVDNSKLNSKEYMTMDGLSALFLEIGLDKETSDSMAEVFGRFVISDEDDTLASEKVKGTRPVPIPAGALNGRASDTTYALNKLTDSGLIATSRSAISQTGATFADTDDILNQNPGYTAVFTQGLTGSVSSLPAGSLHANVTLMAVNESTGHSVIQSTTDFLGYNGLNVNQLFLVDTSGQVVQQFTNNTEITTSYNSADISSNNLTLLYNWYDSMTIPPEGVNKVAYGALGSPPAFGVTTYIEGNLAFKSVGAVKLSNDGSYAAYTVSNALHFANGASLDANSSSLSGVRQYGFLSDSSLAILHTSGSDGIVSSYSWDGGGTYAADLSHVLTSAQTSKFAVLQASGDGEAHFALYYSLGGTDRRLALYSASDADNPVTTLDYTTSDSIGHLSLAYSSSTDTDHVDIGILGELSNLSGDSNTELYRLTFNPRSVAGTRLSRTVTEFDNIFDSENSIKTRASAYKMMEDLSALKTQIKDNSDALEHAVEVLQKNIDLVRAAGLAFLDLSEQVTDADEADAVAQVLRQKIRQNAKGSALNQLENLDAITVAALTYGTE